MADELDVKIRADAGQAAGAMTQFADAANESTERTKSALSSLSAHAAQTAKHFSSSMFAMGHSAHEAGVQIKEQLESIEGAFNRIQRLFSVVGEIATLGFVGEKIKDLAHEYAEYSEQVEHSAQRTGMSTDAIQKLGYAAKQTGISQQEMMAALQHLAVVMGQAERGSKQAQAVFTALGISMKDLKNTSPEEMFYRIANAVRAHNDDFNKATVMQMAFGRQIGAQLIPLMNQGSEAIRATGDEAVRLGGVMGKDVLEEGRKLSSDLGRMDLVMQALKIRIAAALVPALTVFGEKMAENTTASDSWVSKMDAMREHSAAFAETIANAAHRLMEWNRGIWALGTFQYGAAAEHFSNAFASAPAQATYSNEGHGHVENEGEEKKPSFKIPAIGGGSTTKGEAAVAAAQAAAELARLKEGLQEQARANEDAYKSGAIDLRQYYTTRLDIEQSGLKDEIAAKEKEKARIEAIKPQDAAEALQLQAKLITVKAQIDVLNMKLADSGPRAAREEALALRELNDQLAKIEAQKTFSLGEQNIAQEKALLDERVALNEVSKRQEIASEVDLENQRFELQRAELEKERAIAQQYALSKPAELEKVNAQIEEAEAEHQTKMTELAAQGAEEQRKYQVESVQSVDDAFSTMFENIAEGHATLRKTLMDFFNDIDRQISRIVAKSLTEKMFGPGTEGGGFFQSIMGRMFGNEGTAPSSASGAASTTSLMGLGGGLNKSIGDWMKGAGLGASGQITAGQLTAATMSIPTATVANMTVANMIAPGGGGGGGGGGDLIGSLMSGANGAAGGAGNTYGFSLEGTSAMSDMGSAAGMSAPAGLGGIGAGIPMYAQGTNYVPETQLAMLHRGEAVVPARYNKPTPAALNVTNNFSLGQVTDLRTQSQVATLAASTIGRAVRRNG